MRPQWHYNLATVKRDFESLVGRDLYCLIIRQRIDRPTLFNDTSHLPLPLESSWLRSRRVLQDCRSIEWSDPDGTCWRMRLLLLGSDPHAVKLFEKLSIDAMSCIERDPWGLELVAVGKWLNVSVNQAMRRSPESPVQADFLKLVPDGFFQPPFPPVTGHPPFNHVPASDSEKPTSQFKTGAPSDSQRAAPFDVRIPHYLSFKTDLFRLSSWSIDSLLNRLDDGDAASGPVPVTPPPCPDKTTHASKGTEGTPGQKHKQRRPAKRPASKVLLAKEVLEQWYKEGKPISVEAIAKVIPCDRSTLYKSKDFMRRLDFVKAPDRRVSRGSKYHGHVEAYDEPED